MANYYLTENFRSFFGRLNPGPSFEAVASSEYNTIKGLIENRGGSAGILAPKCFLQGSYRQQTATYSINDVDIVALCELWQPAASGGSGRTYGRDEIFNIVAAPLRGDRRYASKVRFGPTSMCIKVDLGIKVEILPVVFKADNYDPLVDLEAVKDFARGRSAMAMSGKAFESTSQARLGIGEFVREG